MNRIILIGNGFDLAHGIKSCYKDFIDDFWCDTIDYLKKQEPNQPFENDLFKIGYMPSDWLAENTYANLKTSIKRRNTSIIFHNKFLEHISEKKGIQN